MRQGNRSSQAVRGIHSQSEQLSFCPFSFLSMFWHINIHHMPRQTYHECISFLCFCGVGKRCVQLLPSDSSFPLCTWLACATKQACVRNQESTSRVYHFNKHLPTKQCFKWERPTLHFIWHPFCRWVCLDVIEQNRQVGLCERKISHYKFWCASMTKYYFPWNAIVESLWKFVCRFRSTSRFL